MLAILLLKEEGYFYEKGKIDRALRDLNVMVTLSFFYKGQNCQEPKFWQKRVSVV